MNLLYMICETQFYKYSNSKRSVASRIFILAIVLIVSNTSLIIFSAANYTPLQLQFVAIPVTMGISAILHLMLAICALIGLILIKCKKHNIGHKSMVAILVFCISLVFSHIFLCITETVSKLVAVRMLILSEGAVVMVPLSYFCGLLYKLTLNPPLFFLNERTDTRTEENLYENMTALQARGRMLPQSVTFSVSRTNSIGTVYEEILLSSSPSQESLPYIDAFGSQEDMHTAMTNL